MPNMKQVAVWALLLVAGLSLWAWAQGLTADEILDQVEEKGFFSTEENLTLAFALSVWEEPSEAREYAFRVWSKEYKDDVVGAKWLIMFESPEDQAGVLLLFHKLEEGCTRVWQYLPALNIRKEIVGKGMEGEFISGSGITYNEIAEGFQYRDEYIPELLGEEELDGQATWKIEFTPKDPEAVDWSKIVIWVEQVGYNLVRAEFRNKAGELARLITAEDLVEDALGLRPSLITFQNFEEGKRSQIRILERSAAEIPDEYFKPENFPTLQLGD